MSKNGKYTFSKSRLMGRGKLFVTSAAASRPAYRKQKEIRRDREKVCKGRQRDDTSNGCFTLVTHVSPALSVVTHAHAPNCIAFSTSSTPHLTITESVSPYTTEASKGKPFFVE